MNASNRELLEMGSRTEMKCSGRIAMKHMLRGNVVTLLLIAAVLMVFAGGTALAASGSGSGGSEVRERAKLTLTGNGVIADVELQLRIDESRTELRARARAEGALMADARFSLCMGSFFVEDDEAEDDGRLDIDEEVQRGFTFVTLVGQNVSIREGGEAAGCTGAVVVMGMVAALD